MFVLIIFCTSCLNLIIADDISVSQFKFVGYKNVYYEGSDHQSIDVGDLCKNVENEALKDCKDRPKIVQICANRCALSGNECSAFYVSKLEDVDGLCHLVDGEDEQTVGHGMDREDIYYIKEQIGSDMVVPRPQGLVPPCDMDELFATDEECANFTSATVETYEYITCESIENTYTGIVGKISDRRCQGEDRILQCELDGGAATSNIEKNRYNLLDLAFSQSWRDVNPFRSLYNEMIQYMEMQFSGGPREIKRIIVRSATDTTVDKLKKGKFTLYKGDETAEIDFEFETENVCAVHLNLFNAIEATKTIAAATDKIRMDILGVYRDIKARTGFKIDLFVNELTLEPPSTGNSTDTN